MPHRAVSAVMNREVRTLRPEMTAREAEQLLAAHHISGAPIVDAQGRVLGVISQSDLVRYDAARTSVAAVGAFFTDVDEYRDLAALPADEGLLRVDALMTREVLAVRPEAPLTEAARRMRQHRVHRLLVIEDDRLRGLVTALDLLRAIEEAAPR